jgi:GDSL-like Lipase/Acylhydrolase family
MRTKTRPRLRSVVAAAGVALLLVTLLASPAGAADDGPRATPPGAYYLSVGDSMAFGLQFEKLDRLEAAGAYAPGRFDSGYTDRVAARTQPLRPGQRTVNLSCPGETTMTMVAGGCFWTTPEPDGPGLTLHTAYAGAQLDAALSFLRSHPGQVNPITVSIGGIDVADVIADECGADRACLEHSGIRERLGASLDRILGALQGAAPDAEIVLVAFHNPFSVEHPETKPLWRRYYTRVEKEAARRNGVGFANVSNIIRASNLCRLTFLCGSGDNHPTDEGYRRIGDLVFREAGFRR